MCRYISAFHHPVTGEVIVADLHSHGATEKLLGLNPAGPYREMHYLPNEDIECRLTDKDYLDRYGETGATMEALRHEYKTQCAERLRERWPTFSEFERWAKNESKRVMELPVVEERFNEMTRKIIEHETAGRDAAKKRVEYRWVNQTQLSGQQGNVSFAGATIFSYGWWPMATLVGNLYCLYRDETYSRTTSKHQLCVRKTIAKAGKVLVFVSNPSLAAIAENRTWYRDQISKTTGYRDRARSQQSKKAYQQRINTLRESRRIYNRLTRKGA